MFCLGLECFASPFEKLSLCTPNTASKQNWRINCAKAFPILNRKCQSCPEVYEMWCRLKNGEDGIRTRGPAFDRSRL